MWREGEKEMAMILGSVLLMSTRNGYLWLANSWGNCPFKKEWKIWEGEKDLMGGWGRRDNLSNGGIFYLWHHSYLRTRLWQMFKSWGRQTQALEQFAKQESTLLDFSIPATLTPILITSASLGNAGWKVSCNPFMVVYANSEE